MFEALTDTKLAMEEIRRRFLTMDIRPLVLEQALQHNGLKSAGVISADTARFYKPHREIFDEGLRVKSSDCIKGQSLLNCIHLS